MEQETTSVPELHDEDRREQEPTTAEVRLAFLAARALDNASPTNAQGQPQPVIKLFNDSGRAKAHAVRLVNGLKSYVESSDEIMQEKFAEHCDGGDVPKDKNRWRRAETALLRERLPIRVSDLAIKASVIGAKALTRAPVDLLSDLGPFLIWDLTDDQMEEAAEAGNRAERRR